MRVPTTSQSWLLPLEKAKFNFESICQSMVYFFADWLVNIPDTSSTNQKRQTMIQVTDEIYSGSGTKQLLRISYNKTSIQTLKRRLESCYSWFFLCSIHVKGCLRRKIFPPKNLEKYGRPKYACANFFLLKKKSKF